MDTLTYIIAADSLIISASLDGEWKTYTLSKSSENYPAIISIISSGDISDAEKVEKIETVLNPAPIEVKLQGYEQRDNRHYFEGVELPEVLVKKLEDIQREGVDMKPFVAFMERLAQNPSASSVNELYDFLSYKKLTITDDGHFLAYKGLRNDYFSGTGNKRTIVSEGIVNSEYQIYNGIGETIRVERNQVDDDRSRQCSFGLHVGSLDYASTFSDGNVVIVKVDPADAVSVPKDHSCQKLRVCGYTVVRDFDKELVSPTATADGEEIVGEMSKFPAARQALLDELSEWIDREVADIDDEYWDDDVVVTLTEIKNDLDGDYTIVQIQEALQALGYNWWEEDGDYVIYL